MPNDYPRQQAEDAQRRRTADMERQHDQRVRQQRAALESWRTAQERRQSADEARRRQQDQERRRPSS
ncbi:MAG: hypothetical protein M3R24_29070 [Chloroflexota bacterium]|nr:hypothetical protein [Chloroflexota bacterium]PLS77480.1 MAG: hypothetical protein CYG59_23560 [Chloroflexota bacterium]